MKYLVKQIAENNFKVMHSTDAKALPRGGAYLFLETEDVLIHPVVEAVDGELTLVEDPIKQLGNQVTEKYDLMVSDVYTEMLNVFGTSNDVSASAFAATWEAMLKRPANFVDAELGFVDAQAVADYATIKIAAADAYGVFRMKRIAQFNAEKAVILGA